VSDAAGTLWTWARRQAVADADHLHSLFFPQDDGSVMTPNESYLRVWLSELFLAKERAWGTDRSPAVHAMVRLAFGGLEPRTFATLVQPPVSQGVFEDYPLTGLLPYSGGAVELQAALHPILGKNHLTTALDILTSFASLLTPPLSAALTISGQLASGIEKIIAANGQDPVLSLHGTRVAPGAGATNELRPGWLAVVRATEHELPASELHVTDGRLCRDGRHLVGFDYLVLRVEGRKERDDWRTPDLDQAISAAQFAKATGRSEEYERLRAEALSRIFFSADLTPAHRNQVARMVQETLDGDVPGAAADGELTVAAMVAERGLPSRESVAGLTLTSLLSS
jgi:hypothetical protein